jgi:hypothetical protein
MDPNHYLKQTCLICRDTKHGRFDSPTVYCDKHQRDEIDLHQFMPEDRRLLSKEDKQLERVYAKRWAKGGSN